LGTGTGNFQAIHFRKTLESLWCTFLLVWIPWPWQISTYIVCTSRGRADVTVY